MTVRKIKSIGDIPYPIDVGADALSPLLTAGAALGITGNTTDSAAWLQRVSTSDGPTTIRSIHGRTLRWNQLVRYASMWGNASTIVTSGTTVTVTSTADNRTYFGVTVVPSTLRKVELSHKYVMRADVDLSGITNANFSKVSFSFGGLAPASQPGNSLEASGKLNAYIVMPSSGTPASIYVNAIYTGGNQDLTGEQFVASNIQVFDLTTMFGAGSEPSTIEEFTALYPLPYYEYDAGSLLPVNMTGIESTAADESWTQTRSIPAGTLRSAGSVYDEQTETERTVRVGAVDMGDLEWVHTASNSPFFYAQLSDATAGASGLMLCECSAYTAVPSADTAKMTTDKTVCIQSGGYKRVLVHDESYQTSDAATFKAAVSGAMLYYVLAEPTITPYDPPLNMTYRTEQGGTERVMVPTGEQSAPPTLVTAQGYTAESLRDAALSAIAPVENGLASTNYAVGSYLVHGGQLCRVTTAIATGESISIGTNVTATTVMAEILSLVQ